MSVYSEKQRNKYEIECDERNNFIACFCEIRTTVYRDGNILNHSYHREVLSLENIKDICASLVSISPTSDS